MDREDGDAVDPPRSEVGLWLGVVGYLLLQCVIAVLWRAWRVLGGSVAVYLLVLLSSGVGLLVVGYRPQLLKGRFIELVLLAAGLPLLSASAVQVWLKPYVFVRVPEWLGGYSDEAELHPLLPAFLSLLVFLAALGHAARLGSRRSRWLLLDAPLFAAGAWVLTLLVRGYPVFQG